MRPWQHFLFSLILAAILYPIFNWIVIFILASGVLIDIDHYFWCIYKFRNYNLSFCNKYFSSSNVKDHIGCLHVFHTIEFLLISIIFSIYSQSALLFTAGLLFHYILDIIHRYKIAKSFISNPSIISWIIKNKIQKQRKT